MSARLLSDARHWRDRAAQIRALSDWMSDAQTRARILKLASDYDKLAEQATESGVSPAQGSAKLACLSVRSDQRTPLS
jgi:hypothetical protein